VAMSRTAKDMATAPPRLGLEAAMEQGR